MAQRGAGARHLSSLPPGGGDGARWRLVLGPGISIWLVFSFSFFSGPVLVVLQASHLGGSFLQFFFGKGALDRVGTPGLVVLKES